MPLPGAVAGAGRPVGTATVSATVYRNGNILTMDTDDSVAAAVGVEEGRIVAVGSEAGEHRCTGDAESDMTLTACTGVGW